MATFVRDSAGKKASVRKSVTPGSELVGVSRDWDWYVELRTGRYYVVDSRR